MLEYVMQSLALSVGFGLSAIVLLWCLYTNRDRNTPPGPIAFPIVGNLNVFMSNDCDILKTFRQMRSKYGELYSLKIGSYDAVVVNGYQRIKELLLKRGDEVSDRPNTFIFQDLSEHLGLVSSFGSIWKIHRTFAITTLRNFGFGKRSIETRIMEEVVVFLQDIESKNGRLFDFGGIIEPSISNIMCSMVFSERFEYKDPRFTKLLGLIDSLFQLVGPSAWISIFPFLKYVPGDPCKGQLIVTCKNKIIEFIQELVDEHKRTYDENNIRDYIDAYLKEQRQNRDTFTDLQLGMSIFDLFVAGTETTATTLRWAMIYLLHHDDVQNKLRQELDDVVGTSRPPSLSDRSNLPYCEAVITEVMRCGNIVPISAHHSCSQDVSFGGFIIKKGSIIIPNLDSVLNDPDVFEKPDIFNPDRYIGEDGGLQGHEKVIPFSVGRRVCLGESLARSELFLYLTSMIQRFIFVAKDQNNLPSLDGIFGLTRMPRPYTLRAIRRDL